ncbi:MAG: LWR-salt protein [Halobacteriales archaeon]|nr:LWR-salt protein [Halobacteriales archaeon]
MEARYRFSVRFRLSPTTVDVTVDPAEFETSLCHRAAPPGEDGWLFFRDHLWRGSVNDPAHFRALVSEALGVTVIDVDYRALEADSAYLSSLREAIAADLSLFNADSVDAVLSNYLGSSIERQPDEE